MAGLKRHRSWHEDFTRNFFKLFSRSKSFDQEKTDIAPDNGDGHEDDGVGAELGEGETSLTTTEAQTLELPDQDGAIEGDDAPEGVVRSDPVRDPPPVTPPALERDSPAPPADSFLRRLGSLFLFARAEPGGGESRSSVETRGSGDAENADPGAQLGGEKEVEGGECMPPVRPQELSHTLELSHSSELSHSVAGQEVKDTLQSEQEIQDTQLQVVVNTEEDGEEGIESSLEEKEEERRRALACPPVVTHGTYRGLREVRRMRRKQEVRLPSPVLEGDGEEGQRRAGASLSSTEEEEVNTVSPPGQACAGASWPSDVTRSGHESHSPAGSSTIGSTTPVHVEGTGSTVGESVVHTQTQSRTKPLDLELDPPSTTDVVGAGEKDSGWPAVCLDVSGGRQGSRPCKYMALKVVSAQETPPLEVESPCKTPPLEAESPCETQTLSHSTDRLLFPQTVEGQETYLSDTGTAKHSNACLTEANTASDALACFIGVDVDSNLQQGGRSHDASPLDHGVSWLPDLVLDDGAAQLEYPEELLGLGTLQVESARMVDNILRNALAALEVIEVSEREREAELLSSDELNEGAESLVLSVDALEGSSGLQRALRERLPARPDGSSQTGPSDKVLVGHAPADGSRSTPSSGYESIAGSDTDIQSSAGIGADVTSASGPIGSEQEGREQAGIGFCTQERELCLEGSPVYQKTGRGSLHSTALLLGANLEEGEGTVRTEANNELLFQYALSDSNISHKTNTTSVPSAISESLSGENKEEVHGESVSQRGNDAGPQYTAKDNLGSNKHNDVLGLDSGDVSPVISENMKSIRESLPLNSVENYEAKQSDLSNEVKDSPEDQVSLAAWQRSGAGVVAAEGEEVPERACQGLRDTRGKDASDRHSRDELSFVLVQTYLASVVEDVPDSETGEREVVPARPGSIRMLCSDGGRGMEYSLPCSITIDQSEAGDADPAAGLSLERAGSRPIVLAASARAPPDLPGSSGRLQASEQLHGPGGFAIISEEEETDAVFVNDTGPMLSPGARRARAYPFSLSPIYEEDSGREDCSREEALHVPPATGEEQRSVEQQASSILSLLQSVSERLLSSALDGAESEEDAGGSEGSPGAAGWDATGMTREGRAAEEMSWPQRSPRPLWERYGDDDGDGDGDGDGMEERSTLLLHQQFSGAGLSGVETASVEGGLPDQEFSRAQNVEAQRTYDESTRNTVVKTDTPFYQYLKSSIVPPPDREKPLLCYTEESLMSPTVKDLEGFGKVSPRPTLVRFQLQIQKQTITRMQRVAMSALVNARPDISELHIFEGLTGGGCLREVHRDVEDAHRVVFPHGATVRALRGCWLLYVEPGFRGSCVLLEEGETVLSGRGSRERDPSAPLAVGSIRRAVKDDSIPEIHVHRTGEIEPAVLHCEADLIDMRGPVHLSDLSVCSGCWLAYDGAGFTGLRMLLEPGSSSTSLDHDRPASHVRSLRPLRMGALRVRRPLDPKMVVYEKPLFQGQCRELTENMPRLQDEEGLLQIASLQVTGGVWVGYSCENFTGEQCVLEEGEFPDCTALFSGPELTLKSCRFLQADFVEPAVCLRSSGEQLEILDQDVTDLRLTALSQGLDAIHVRSGVWVTYSGRSYTGQQCVLERGQHSGTLHWGGSQSSPLSIRPIRREICGEKEPKFLLRAYSQPGFAGESQEFGSEVADCAALDPASFRVILGSWLLYDEEGYCGNQFVVAEGQYPDLASCGNSSTTIRSFRPIPYTFSESSATLYSLTSFEGLETVVDLPMESMENIFTQSLRVNSGLWVAYEFGRFKGRQMLLQKGECPCWGERSGWDTVGSLHPLHQRRAYLHIRTRSPGTVALTAETSPGASSPAKLSLSPADRMLEMQHWVYGQSLLRSRVDKSCLSVIGAKASTGARVALWTENGRTQQKWSLNDNGTISSHLNRNLVLDRRGGSGSDRDHLILSEFCAGKASQYWDIEVL